MIYEDFSSLDHTKTRAQYTATCGSKIYDSALRKIDDENIIKSSLALNCFLKSKRVFAGVTKELIITFSKVHSLCNFLKLKLFLCKKELWNEMYEGNNQNIRNIYG